MQEGRHSLSQVLREISHARYTKAEDLHRSIPATHDLGGLQAVMHKLVGTGVVETVAELAADIKQVPNRKAFLARQHGGNAVALDVLHGRAVLAFNLSGTEYLTHIGAAQSFGALGF